MIRFLTLALYSFIVSLIIKTSCFAQPSKAGATLPNIILVNMDDMGFGDVDTYGAINYTTPHIDMLAA